MIVVVGLGSNMGDRLAHLQQAADGLMALACSPVYESVPVGGPEQPDYLNAVVLVEAVGPREALERCRAAETVAGREREVRWGPRTLDADVVAADDVVLDEPDLVVPHPRAAERAFVLRPWLDLQPTAVLPGRGSVADLLAGLGDDGVRRTSLVLEVRP